MLPALSAPVYAPVAVDVSPPCVGDPVPLPGVPEPDGAPLPLGMAPDLTPLGAVPFPVPFPGPPPPPVAKLDPVYPELLCVRVNIHPMSTRNQAH